MKPRDMASIKHALTEVLNTKGDGQTSQWSNAGTGNSVKIEASMTPERTIHEAGKTCRQIAVVLSAKGQSLNLHPLFCRAGQADWALQKR
jgi:surface antigen